MQQRLIRGIQYEDVARAADALLHEGMRPTIERIRQQIGRGSPNTVSPMLEQWFSGLGKRLNGAGSEHSHPCSPGQGVQVPDALLQMAQALWQRAASEAQVQSELQCAEERASLASQARKLHEAQAQLDAREMALNERVKALETALRVCQQQLADSQAHWQASLRTVAARDAEIAGTRSALTQAREKSDGLQQSIQTLQQQMLEEHTALEERHHAAQQRWLVEVDRARQETRKAALQTEQNLLQRHALQQVVDTLRADYHAQALEHGSLASTLRSELSAALHAAEQSRLLLEKAQADNGKLQLQLTRQEAMVARPDEITATFVRARRASLGRISGGKRPERRTLKKSLR